MVLGGLLVSLAENKKAEIGDNETSLSHIGEADIGEADHQTDHDPDQRNNQAGNRWDGWGRGALSARWRA